jgi:hypothetical protein
MGMRRSFKPKNFVVNGNFASNTSGWTGSDGLLSVGNNTLTLTGTGVSNLPKVNQSTLINASSVKYVKMQARVTNANCTSLFARWSTGSPGNIEVVAPPIENQWYELSGISSQASSILYVYHQYTDAATANGKIMEVREVLAIDLTATFGAGNEPTLAWCDANIPAWFDGTMSGGKMGGIGGLK